MRPELAERASRIARHARYLELSEDPRFTEAFMERISFDDPECGSVDDVRAVASGLGFEVVHELDPATLVGPLVDGAAFAAMQAALAQAEVDVEAAEDAASLSGG